MKKSVERDDYDQLKLMKVYFEMKGLVNQLHQRK